MSAGTCFEKPARDYERFVEEFSGKQAEVLYNRHATLNQLLERCLLSTEACPVSTPFDPASIALRNDLLAAWQDCLERRIPATRVPQEPQSFVEWFTTLVKSHEIAKHPLATYVAKEATGGQLGHFLTQELMVYDRFNALLYHTWLHLDAWGMLWASNYWETLGPEKIDAVYECLYRTMQSSIGIDLKLTPPLQLPTVEVSWQALACRNALFHSVLSRYNVVRGIGLQMTIALLFPHWFSCVVDGLERLGLRAAIEDIRIGTRHDYPWLSQMIKLQPRTCNAIVTGAFYWLLTASAYYSDLHEKYRNGFLR